MTTTTVGPLPTTATPGSRPTTSSFLRFLPGPTRPGTAGGLTEIPRGYGSAPTPPAAVYVFTARAGQVFVQRHDHASGADVVVSLQPRTRIARRPIARTPEPAGRRTARPLGGLTRVTAALVAPVEHAARRRSARAARLAD